MEIAEADVINWSLAFRTNGELIAMGWPQTAEKPDFRRSRAQSL